MQRQTWPGRMSYDKRGGGWSDVVARQGMPRVDGNHQKLGWQKEGFYSGCQREHDPAIICIFDFWIQEL